MSFLGTVALVAHKDLLVETRKAELAIDRGGTIIVKTSQHEDLAQPSVSIEISDTGCGMDPDTRAKAFEPFFTTKGDGGTGLGLVIVDQIVSRSGGQLSIDSELGSGTTVRMFLPRIASSTEEAGRRAS